MTIAPNQYPPSSSGPAGFEQLELPPARRPPEVPAGRRGTGWRRFELVRQVVRGPLWVYPVIFTLGMMVAGVLIVRDGELSRFFDDSFRDIVLTLIVLLSVSLSMAGRLSTFAPLPVSRKVLFAALILPSALTLVLGYGAGRLALVVLGESRDAGPALPVVLLLVGLPWLLLMSIVFRTLRAGLPEWVPGAVFGLIVAMLLMLFAASSEAPGPLAAGGWFDTLLRQLGASRAGILAAWLGSALLLLGGYALAEASFERIELAAGAGDKSGLPGLGGGS